MYTLLKYTRLFILLIHLVWFILKISFFCNLIKVQGFFICHIINYTGYNQKWNVEFIVCYVFNRGLKHLKGIIHPKKYISVINYSSSCNFKPIRPKFIFETKIKIFLLKSECFLTLHRPQQNQPADLMAIHIYFTRWLIRTNSTSLVQIHTIFAK